MSKVLHIADVFVNVEGHKSPIRLVLTIVPAREGERNIPTLAGHPDENAEHVHAALSQIKSNLTVGRAIFSEYVENEQIRNIGKHQIALA